MPRREFTAEEDAYLRQHYSSVSLRDAAQHLARSKASISHRVQRLGIRKKPLRRWAAEEDEFIRTNVHRLLKDVAKLLGRCQSEVSQRAKRIGIPDWRTARGYKLKGGYVVRAYRREGSGGQPIMEHTAVMEEALGRSLEPGEIVHHINGVMTDNRVSNLCVFPGRSEHRSAHQSLDLLLPGLLERKIIWLDGAEGVYRLCEKDD